MSSLVVESMLAADSEYNSEARVVEVSLFPKSLTDVPSSGYVNSTVFDMEEVDSFFVK